MKLEESGRHPLHIQTGRQPVESHVVSPVVVNLHFDLRLSLFVVVNSEVEVGRVAAVGKRSVVGGQLFRCDIEGVARYNSDILISGNVVDAVLPNEFEGSIG